MQEGMALSHERDIIDIYSNSWGPSDAGFIVEGPRTMAQMALRNGTSKVKDELYIIVNLGHLIPYYVYYRDGTEKGQFMYGQMVMEVFWTTALLMDLHPVFTPYLLELSES